MAVSTEQPNYAGLYTSLANSKTQQSNNALYQTIFFLIQRVTQSQGAFVKDIQKLNTTVSALLNVSYLTVNDESSLLFNSRQLLPGTNVSFDDTVAHQRTINVTSGGTPTPPSAIAANAFISDVQPPHEVYENEIYATLVNSSFGGSGSVGPAGPTGPQGPMGPPALELESEYIEPPHIPGPQGPAGSGSTALLWTLLTNGDLIEPELIFAAGDVIWVNVP